VSIEIPADEVAGAIERYAVAYLLTLGNRPRPHVAAVSASVTGGVVRVRGVGKTALADIAGHEEITLLWAPAEPAGYSLILDGTATVVGDRIDVVPRRAVLHRPAPATQPSDGSCASDCVELPVKPPKGA